MHDIAIKAEKVSKVFRIYDRPSDRLKEVLSLNRRKYHSDFPALNDIDFEVRKGQFLGIVGKNGAGKSTLLKILSRELTPMLEDIIAFADIGEFIRHPVKTYSSGMYSRLSFAVGVNVDPDILIADEVLAVGDMRFAQKCLRKMREFKEKGKTIILVTHDASSVNVFCDIAMWLKDGEIFQMGDAKSVTTDFINFMLYDKLPDEYITLSLEDSQNNLAINRQSPNRRSTTEKFKYDQIQWEDVINAPGIGEGGAKITEMALYTKEPFQKKSVLAGNENIYLLLKVKIEKNIQKPHFGFVLYDGHNLPALHSNSDLCGGNLKQLNPGEEAIVCFEIKLPGLSNGSYIFAVSAEANQAMLHRVHDVLPIQIVRPGLQGTQCGHVIIEEQRVEMLVNITGPCLSE
ncbi:MAG: ABC transporter ATP-binding protein [Nitrospirae bacterium]|nr:ABC transporter ATP-binding protein [Nitrospirota bacterium]